MKHTEIVSYELATSKRGVYKINRYMEIKPFVKQECTQANGNNILKPEDHEEKNSCVFHTKVKHLFEYIEER
jgi:hypothetical protein